MRGGLIESRLDYWRYHVSYALPLLPILRHYREDIVQTIDPLNLKSHDY
jgi:hypothetical protein